METSSLHKILRGKLYEIRGVAEATLQLQSCAHALSPLPKAERATMTIRTCKLISGAADSKNKTSMN